jgi:hypothetical protein
MRARVLVAVGLVASLGAGALSGAWRVASDEPLEGRAPARAMRVPAVEAAFRHESYRPGERARLVIRDRSHTVTMQVFRSGPEAVPTLSDTVMNGVPVTRERLLRRPSGRQVVRVRVGAWESGLYFARLEAADGRLGFAPFVVAPRRLGVRDVAVVLPTLTWQAYNFRDEDRDGHGDSWYTDKRLSTVRLGRAHLNRGVPYGFRANLGFLQWLHESGTRVDVLAQWDLERVRSPKALARAYDLLVFAGHHEYVTEREYDLVERYRDRGGNLLFLSANNFFWRVERKGEIIEKAGRWRELGRPEAALVGVQYVAHQPSPRGAWIVRRSRAADWLFADTGLVPGSSFARGGVEIDQVTRASPRSVQIVAEIPDLFGPGRSAQMTYYETPAGAKVFAAGAFHLTRAITTDPDVWMILENLWARLAMP